MRDFNTGGVQLPAELVTKFQTILLHMILGRCAYYGIIITAFLFAISVVTTLPFSPMWGFVIVPLGAVFGWFTTRKLNIK